ncbi:MAG: hypothetical protein JSV68_16270 [Anaerolineaceae bacterium]|nr:MAG: hypothetical protein JSV68_16270 [Anaerolineaceae bacterium]
MRDQEYDRFGPWVIEISQNDPPPPLFLPYLTRSEEPLFSVKIPRTISRRDANPGMNLYDYLVTLYGKDIVILERVGDEVREHIFPYDEIHYLVLTEELLKGIVQLGLPDQIFNLPFNMTSATTMRYLTDLVRERYAAVEPAISVDAQEPGLEKGFSNHFDHLLAEQRVGGSSFRFLAGQPDTSIATHEANPFRKLIFGAADKTLMESMHFCDGRELKVISRGSTFKYRWQKSYRTDLYTVPVPNIMAIRTETDSSNSAITLLYIETRAGTRSYGFLSNNPTLETYLQLLEPLIQTPSPSSSLRGKQVAPAA